MHKRGHMHGTKGVPHIQKYLDSHIWHRGPAKLVVKKEDGNPVLKVEGRHVYPASGCAMPAWA